VAQTEQVPFPAGKSMALGFMATPYLDLATIYLESDRLTSRGWRIMLRISTHTRIRMLKFVRTTITMSPEFREMVFVASKATGVPVSELIRRGLQSYFSQNRLEDIKNEKDETDKWAANVAKLFKTLKRREASKTKKGR
jgi:hypothetical protein